MTAADKKIILEKGSDYVMLVTIPADDGINTVDMHGWGLVFEVFDKTGIAVSGMTLGYKQVPGQTLRSACEYVYTVADTLTKDGAVQGDVEVVINDDVYIESTNLVWRAKEDFTWTTGTTFDSNSTHFEEDVHLSNGNIAILVPGEITQNFSTGVTGTDLFATEYNYYHRITLVQKGSMVTAHTTRDAYIDEGGSGKVIVSGASYTPNENSREIRLARGKLAVRI